MDSNVLYFNKTVEFFLYMVDTIEEEAVALNLPLYRERRRGDKIVISLSIENRMYPISFMVRERPNKKEMEIIGKLSIGKLDSQNIFIFGVYTHTGGFGSNLLITPTQSLVWEIFSVVENKEQVRISFLKILRMFYTKAYRIHREWNTYLLQKNTQNFVPVVHTRKTLE